VRWDEATGSTRSCECPSTFATSSLGLTARWAPTRGGPDPNIAKFWAPSGTRQSIAAAAARKALTALRTPTAASSTNTHKASHHAVHTTNSVIVGRPHQSASRTVQFSDPHLWRTIAEPENRQRIAGRRRTSWPAEMEADRLTRSCPLTCELPAFVAILRGGTGAQASTCHARQDPPVACELVLTFRPEPTLHGGDVPADLLRHPP
jgi:hypothetical protein